MNVVINASRGVLLFLFVAGNAIIVPAAIAEPTSNLRVLMTVGGVDYYTGLVRNLRAMPALDLVIGDFDETQTLFSAAQLAEIDVILMYHRDNVAEPEEKAALMAFLNRGGGVVVLHHSIANYSDWREWWRDLVGGLYVLDGDLGLTPSRYNIGFEGVAIRVGSHAITERFDRAWRYQDESYTNLWVSDDVIPLLRTTAFGSDELLAWVGPSTSGRIVYIQPGHGDRIMRQPIYLNLIEDALRWAATAPSEYPTAE